MGQNFAHMAGVCCVYYWTISRFFSRFFTLYDILSIWPFKLLGHIGPRAVRGRGLMLKVVSSQMNGGSGVVSINQVCFGTGVLGILF